MTQRMTKRIFKFRYTVRDRRKYVRVFDVLHSSKGTSVVFNHLLFALCFNADRTSVSRTHTQWILTCTRDTRVIWIFICLRVYLYNIYSDRIRRLSHRAGRRSQFHRTRNGRRVESRERGFFTFRIEPDGAPADSDVPVTHKKPARFVRKKNVLLKTKRFWKFYSQSTI